jgi:HTH-type transcriptional regulator/antitoxin HigA
MAQTKTKLTKMTTKLIKTEAEYDVALARVDELFDAKKGTKDFDEVELLLALVEMYEAEHYAIEAPDPIEALKFRMEQMDMKRSDLEKFLGTRARVSEILNRKRNLTVKLMKVLHKELGVPAESLLAQ